MTVSDITFVAHQLALTDGGSSFSLDLITRSLSDRGYDVSVITIEPEKNVLPDEPSIEVIAPSEGQFNTRIGMLRSTYKIMRQYKDSTDLFHIFAPNLLPAGGLFRKRSDVPVVGRLNSYTLFCVNHDMMNGECHKNCGITQKFKHDQHSLPKRIAKLPLYTSRTVFEPSLAGAVDRCFAVSPAVKEIYTAAGLPAEKITVVPNFYDPSFHSPAANSSTTESPQQPLKTLYVGRLKHAKGVDILVRAISQTERIEATIVGPGPAKDELETLSSELGVGSRVTFMGQVEHDRLHEHYYAADVFVQPSRWPEPFSRTLLESLQCKTPAIVSDVGGSSWAVGDAGLVFPSDQPAALVRLLEQLQSDPERLTELRSSCKSRIAEFAPENSLSKLVSNYESVLSEGQGRRGVTSFND